MRRRDFLYALTAATMAGMSPAAVRAAVPASTRRVLWLRRAGTGEEIAMPFCIDGRTVYDPGYRAICWLMRDMQIAASAGYVRFDIVEIEALWELQQTLALQGIRRPLIVTSGYRSVQTNAATENAARNSMHCYAKAADLYVDGVSTRELFDAAWSRAVSGGIGYYPTHVHLDSGSRRWWVGEIAVPTLEPSLGRSAGEPAVNA
ncbi:MAG: YcbK family protein [Candidatus Eremiobacteraeota bacterium]|nr:YcbK family protein [Candidatus Eremiobacteraeota bacterium]